MTSSTITATVRANGTGTVELGGVEHTINTGSPEQVRAAIVKLVAGEAEKRGTSLRVLASEPDGTWPVVVTPDGQVQPDDHPDTGGQTDTVPQPEWPRPAHGWRTPPQARSGESFLPGAAPARSPRTGWRGTLDRIGIRVPPSATELAYRDDADAVSQHWPGTRTIVVANGKGGSNKTPTVILLSAVLARFGGGGVVAWGNHQMRGTLGWRTVQGGHEATTRDLLADAPALAAASGRAGDLGRYVHHQPADRYDVLRNNPEVTAGEERFDHHAVDQVHEVLAKYYRVIVIDSDNDESSPHWQRMVDHADQLVVATTSEDVAAEAGRLMLDSLLRSPAPRHAALAARAVVIVSQASREDSPAAAVGAKFAGRGLATATLPYDPGMRRLRLAFDQLQPDTQRAAVHAAGVVARAL